MKKGRLISFSGLPGSGKSSLATRLASHLSANYLRIDTIEQGLRDICKISQIEGEGYELAYRIAEENLRLGNTVIADSVNPLKITRNAWKGIAENAGASLINIEIVCPDKNEHKSRVETRGPSAPGLTPLAWKEVSEREYEKWEETVHVLETSGKTETQCFNELILRLSDFL